MNERRIMRDEYCEGVCVGRVENHKERRRRRVPRIIRFLIIVFVGLVVTRTFADTYSLESVLRGEVPSRDKIYFSHPMLVVQQVVKGGALVRLHHLLSEGCETRVIMLAMDATGLVDDAAMTKRFFRYSGTTTYTTVTGADKTVHLFSQISNDELRSLAEKEEQDRALREAEEKSRAEREQPEREKLIAKLFSKVNLDVGKVIYVDNGLTDNLSVEVKHFRWERLQDFQRKADWLSFINLNSAVANFGIAA